MIALLDTHALLWWVCEPERLSPTARGVLQHGDNRLLWSVASTWELAIKANRGKLRVPQPIGKFLAGHLLEEGIDLLAVEQAHALAVADLPGHHRDPFDRLLVAQALYERVPLLSADTFLSKYGVERIW